MATLYAGPGKVFLNNVGLQAEGENGPIRAVINEDTAEYAAAMFGRIGEQLRDQTAEITTRPFDNWSLMSTLYPRRIGVTTRSSTGALSVGDRPHGASDIPAKIWAPDGRLYTFFRTAVVGHPTMHLGIGKALFGDCTINAIGATNSLLGDPLYMMSVVESAAPDPGGAMTMDDFVRTSWTGTWGTLTGFDAIQAEEEWTVDVAAKYSYLKVQGRTLAAKLDSVNCMARCRPYGPTHTQIMARLAAHKHGQRLFQADLTLTSLAGLKTITLKNAEVKGGGFEFGGTTLGTGEIAFVNEIVFSAGIPQPGLIISD